MRLLRVPVILGLLGLLAFVGLRTGVIERRFIYFPEQRLDADPSSVGLPFEDAEFEAADGVRLHGWFVPGSRDVTLLWFHGNAGNIGHRVDNLRLLHDRLETSILIFDYRGYGRSEGTPSEEGLYLDAEAALAYLVARDDRSVERVVYYGRSLGAAVAVETAARHRPYGLILESPFPSVRYMARRVYPFLPGWVWRALQSRYDSVSKVGGLGVPLLVLHGDRDETAPLDGAKRLFEAASEPKELFIIPGAGHNDTYIVGGEPYFNALRRFVDGLGASDAAGEP